jgi:hypothetical protein
MKSTKVPRRAMVNGILHYVPASLQWCNNKYVFESVADRMLDSEYLRFFPHEASHCVQQF